MTKVGKSDREGTFAGARGVNKVAPISAVRGAAIERQGSTLSGHSGPRRNSNRRAPTYGTVLGARCPRKVEMSPRVQS